MDTHFSIKKSSSVILTENQFIFSKPTKFSEPIAIAEKGKLILIKKCKNNWCKIKVKIFLDGYYLKILG